MPSSAYISFRTLLRQLSGFYVLRFGRAALRGPIPIKQHLCDRGEVTNRGQRSEVEKLCPRYALITWPPHSPVALDGGTCPQTELRSKAIVALSNRAGGE